MLISLAQLIDSHTRRGMNQIYLLAMARINLAFFAADLPSIFQKKDSEKWGLGKQ